MPDRTSKNNAMPGWLAEGLKHVWLPYAQMKTVATPLPVLRTEGARIVLTDGRELIDGIASWWTAWQCRRSIRRQRRVYDAVNRAADKPRTE